MLLKNILTSCIFKLLNNCGNNRYRHWPQSNNPSGNWVAIEDHAITSPSHPEWIHYFLSERLLTEIYEELCARGEEPDLLSVLTVLASGDIPGLPPGGGIQSKYEAPNPAQMVFVHICIFMGNDTVLVLCYRRNCIISAYYQQRETHKATLPNVSKKKMHCENEFGLRLLCRHYAPFLLFVGLWRMLRGLLDWFSKDSWRNCLYYSYKLFFMCKTWQNRRWLT